MPVGPVAVIVHDAPNEVPPGGRILARIRVEGGGLGLSDEKIRKRLREEAAVARAAVVVENGHLAFPAEDAGLHEWKASGDRGLVDTIAGRKVVRGVDDHRAVREQIRQSFCRGWSGECLD